MFRGLRQQRKLTQTLWKLGIFVPVFYHLDFDPASVVRLIRSGHEVSVAIYPKKVVMWDQAKTAIEAGDERDLSMLSSSLVANIGATQRSVVNGFVEVLDGPTGFMVITRKAFEKMHEKYKDL